LRVYRYALDLQMFAGEKTEKGTPKKRQDARKEGQVARSVELPAAFILLFTFLSFSVLGGFYKTRLMSLFGDLFESWMTMNLSAGNVVSLFTNLMFQVLILLSPIFAIAVLIALIGNFAQFGFMLNGKGLTPKFNKINPITGFKQIFSMKTAVEFLKSITKLLIIGYMVYLSIMDERTTIINLSHLSIQDIGGFVSSVTMALGIKIGVILVILAIFDYMYQRYEFEKSLKMSKQDIKDEHKKSEGDPLIKGKIRERQRQMAMQRMMQDVPKADVVITNPTHFAVALKYDAGKMEAPVVLAKGMDYVALRIRETAKENEVMTMENRPLARALYDRAEIGEVIPADLFQAVAEVLAYVYKLKNNVKSS
jgi:flagellar biosynthetic protein FlhB